MPRGIPNKKKPSNEELYEALAKQRKDLTKNPPSVFPSYPGYESLNNILHLALIQAAKGKGNVRHAQGQSFDQQPMQQISQLLNSAEGMRYQAIKKIQESVRMPQEPAIQELLGAINYCAGTILYLQAKHEVTE